MQNDNQLELREVLGTENPADLVTKHLDRDKVDKCMPQLSQCRNQGRAETGLELQGAKCQ